MKVQGRWLETALLGSKFWNKPLFLDSSYQPSIYYLILPYVPTWNFFPTYFWTTLVSLLFIT